MNKLNTKNIYYLGDLTDKQLVTLLCYLKNYDSEWELTNDKDFKKDLDSTFLHFTEEMGWNWTHEEPNTNAKELFYTLEDIQVDCRYLTNDQIDEIADVFKKAGYRIGSLFLMDEYCFIRENKGKYCLVTTKDKNKTKITYDKFMELFGYKEKSEEFKNLVEVLNEELTEEAYKETEYEVKYIAEKPQHYSKGIDTFARMEANCTKEECLAFAKGNIDKYNWRNKGQDLEDFQKIISYANWAISQLKK